MGHNDIDYTTFFKGTAKMPYVVLHSRPFGTCIMVISLIETSIRVYLLMTVHCTWKTHIKVKYLKGNCTFKIKVEAMPLKLLCKCSFFNFMCEEKTIHIAVVTKSLSLIHLIKVKTVFSAFNCRAFSFRAVSPDDEKQ